MEVAHDLYNARRYPLPCLRAQNLTTNHRNGHRLAGCQVPRLVPTCWYQVGQKLAAGSTVNRGAIFDHHSKRFTILHSSSSFSTVFMYPLIQRKLQRNHTNERIKQRILNSNFGESRAVESIRANLLLSRFRYHRLLRVSPPRWLGRYLRYQRWYMYGLNRPRHAQSQGVSNSPLYAIQSEKKHAHGCA